MTTPAVRRPAGMLALTSDTREFLNLLGQSNLFGCRSEAEVIAKVAMGADIGLSPAQSLTSIHVVEGRPMLGSNCYAAVLRAHPHYDYRVRELSIDVCSLEFFYLGGGERESLGVFTITMAEADHLGWTAGKKGRKTNWRKFPRAMLFARAISMGTRYHAPDVFHGGAWYVEGEIEPGELAPGAAEPRVVHPTSVFTEPAPEPVLEDAPPAGDATPEQLEEIATLRSLLGACEGPFENELAELYRTGDASALSAAQAAAVIRAYTDEAARRAEAAIAAKEEPEPAGETAADPEFVVEGP